MSPLWVALILPIYAARGWGEGWGVTDHPKIVAALVKAGADVNQCRSFDGNHNTLLHEASQLGDAGVVSTLMACNASLTVKNRQDQLPIDVAANDQIRQLINDEMTARFDHGLKRAVDSEVAAAAVELEQDIIQPESGEGVGGFAGTVGE